MCGLTGIYNLNDCPVSLEILQAMNRTLEHRGPDEEGYFINTASPFAGANRIQSLVRAPSKKAKGKGHVGLGHKRLSIIDLATGQQPLCNEDSTVWIVFNGEIYNFKDIKTELESKGHRFRTASDTETIVHAYEEWGEDCVRRFRGMFAFAIWDENRQHLFLSRDRLGKKPLYYYLDDEKLVFASEIKAILEIPGIKKDLDFTALSDYLSLTYIPSPKSIFKYIRKLPAASHAVVSREGMRISPYWDLDFCPDYSLSEKQIIDGILGILDEATRIRMISEVPLGAFLSGGVDSSAVVAMMARENETPVITNAISFSESLYNEAPYARQVAKLFGADHNEHKVAPDAIPIIETLSWHYDEPFADSSAVPTFYVSETARKNVTVSLSGDGGDENFAGYSRYYNDSRENRVRGLLPQGLQKPVFEFLRDLYPSSGNLASKLKGKAFIANVARDPVDAYFYTVSAVHGNEKKRLMNADVLDRIKGYSTLDLFKDYYKKAPAEDHLSRLQYLDIKTYLCDDILTKVDRASMAVSLEVRSPLLDHVFMEYVARIPKSYKLSGKNGKQIFKKALERYLPGNILYRQKMGFALPVAEWLRKEIKSYGGEIILHGPATEAFLNKNYVRAIWDEHQNRGRDWSVRLWMIMMLNLWYGRFAG